MSVPGDIVVTGLGVVSPVGLCVQATCAALRAGIARMGEIETHFVDGELLGKVPVIGGRVPTERFEEGYAPDEWPGHDRFEVPPPSSREKLVAPERSASSSWWSRRRGRRWPMPVRHGIGERESAFISAWTSTMTRLPWLRR